MIRIGKVNIGLDYPPYYIADIAANHNGSLQKAFELIELAKEHGAHAAKFQNFTAEKIVSDWGFRENIGQISHQSTWSKSVFDTYADASLPGDWTPQLKAKCDEVGIEYMTSPYDLDNVDLADPYVNAYKIGSGDITWPEILRHIASKNKPVMLATGASSLEDVKRAVQYFPRNNLVLMQCNTNYTADSSNYPYINLKVLNTYAMEFPEVILGLSDHLHGASTVIAAIALGARVIEKHFTDDNHQEGPDHLFSMTPKTFREMVDAGNEAFLALGDGIKRIEENEQQTAIIQRRGLYYSADKKEGELFSDADFNALRPALPGGFFPWEAESLIGKKLLRSVSANTLIQRTDVE